MKKYIYLILSAIIISVFLNVFFSAKKHVEAVKVVDELVVKSETLHNEIKSLNKVKDSVMCKMEILDSTIQHKDSLILRQNFAIKTLKSDKEKLKMVSPIYIRDTVYITESKNFWGRRKRKIESTSNVDSLQLDSIEMDSTLTDTTNVN